MSTVVSVSELNRYLKLKLDGDEKLRGVSVSGELSNFTNHYKTGHFYFSLKDDKSVIRAVMFAGNASRIKFLPENGMKVIVTGRVAIFERDGNYQLYAESMEPDGVGSLFIAYEQLKRKLEDEGLFGAAHKRPIPKYPRSVGVITSPTGAAVRDIINIVTRRYPLAKIILFPALVQGAGAPAQLISGLRYFNKTESADTIIIGRGGGSIEELWAFNDEQLAREIYQSKIPVISAVGHETDFTIADFAADLRAPTPSAAAEIAVPDICELKQHVENLRSKIRIMACGLLSMAKSRVGAVSSKKVLASPQTYLDDRRMELLRLQELLSSKAENLIEKCANRHRLSAARLASLNPVAVIARGYSMATLNGEVLVSAKKAAVGDRVELTLSDGQLSCTVGEIRLKG